jgi:hypothetical protein
MHFVGWLLMMSSSGSQSQLYNIFVIFFSQTVECQTQPHSELSVFCDGAWISMFELLEKMITEIV